jgi:hypothetical protein
MSGSGLYVLIGFALEFDKVVCTCGFGIVATLIGCSVFVDLKYWLDFQTPFFRCWPSHLC